MREEELPVASSLVVLSNVHVGDGYWHVRIRAEEDQLLAKPGQFFHLKCPTGASGPSYLRRPMSVYAINRELGFIEFLYKVTGVGTQGLASLQPWDELDIFGPLGVGFELPAGSGRSLIVARGVGLATMGPLVGGLVRNGNSVLAICSFRRPEAEVGLVPFELAGVEVHRVYDSDGSSDVSGLGRLIDDLSRVQPFASVYTCGSARLARLLSGLACLSGVPSQIAVEQRMACGLGMCHACVVPVCTPVASTEAAGDTGISETKKAGVQTKRVCCEGPVFGLDEIVGCWP